MNKGDSFNSQNARSVLTRLGFTVSPNVKSRSQDMIINGQTHQITAKAVKQVAKDSNPESITDFYVKVDGKRFPPKQLIRLVIGV